MAEKRPKALYSGKLPIGGKELNCYVLDDEKNTRILSATMIFEAFGKARRGANDRLEIDGIRVPPFLASQSLEPYINEDVLYWATPVQFSDGGTLKSGYRAELLAKMCEIYLQARRDGNLKPNQMETAKMAEILQGSFATVGLIALIDEATGFQQNRKSDALRILLNTYLADGIKKWIKEFPDDFFLELDRLYGNQNIMANKRPQYYGHFINKYVYEPIEHGKINPELQKRYKADNKVHKKHQHLTDFGSSQLRIQIGKILGLMQVAPNLKWFKQKQERQGQLSLFPDLE